MRHNMKSNAVQIPCGKCGGYAGGKFLSLPGRSFGVKRRAVSDIPFFHEVHTSDKLDALLPAADVLIAALPQTENTISMLNGRRLRLMKRGEYLVNIGRGSAVDTNALTKALRRRELAGAALDAGTDRRDRRGEFEKVLWRSAFAQSGGQKNRILYMKTDG